MDVSLTALMGAFVAGLVTSASPCALAAVPVAIGFVGGRKRSPARAWVLSAAFTGGLTAVLVVLGVLSARLGLLMGTLPGSWTIAVGLVIIAAGLGLWWLHPPTSWKLPASIERRMAGAGAGSAFVLGALLSTAMSPCATPALAAALAIVGTGAVFGDSMWWGLALLLAYGVGHGLLVLVAGAMPAAAQTLLVRARRWDAWFPGRRFFAVVLMLAGAWWVALGASGLA
jgi:cytochrome c biogenesis protein CcdA